MKIDLKNVYLLYFDWIIIWILRVGRGRGRPLFLGFETRFFRISMQNLMTMQNFSNIRPFLNFRGVGCRGLDSRASPPVLVGVTSLPMILLRGEGFGVSSTIFYGHMVLLLTSYLATVVRRLWGGKGAYNLPRPYYYNVNTIQHKYNINTIQYNSNTM